jgi:hypothetical protein
MKFGYKNVVQGKKLKVAHPYKSSFGKDCYCLLIFNFASLAIYWGSEGKFFDTKV